MRATRTKRAGLVSAFPWAGFCGRAAEGFFASRGGSLGREGGRLGKRGGGSRGKGGGGSRGKGGGVSGGGGEEGKG